MQHRILRGLLATAAALTLAATAVAPAQAAPTAKPDRYAALGDSFPAGAGLDPTLAYPELLTDGMVANLAISGYSTHAILMDQVPLIPRTAKQVTVTTGGNDATTVTPGVDVSPIGLAVACLSGNDLCTDTATAAVIGGAAGELPALLKAIQARAPQARIYVAGYPRLFDPNSSGENGQLCVIPAAVEISPAGYVPIADTAAASLDAATAALNQRIQYQVAVALAADRLPDRSGPRLNVQYVDVTEAFAGHGLCDSLTTGSFVQDLTSLAPLHPTVAGQAKCAEIIAATSFVSAIGP